jgi:thymidine phosphorylase
MANQKNSKDRIMKVINDGSAFEVFNKMVYEHGGDLKKIKTNYSNITEITSDKNGYIKYVNTKKIGNAVNFLTILNGTIDYNAGIKFFKKNSDSINKGDVICHLFGNNINNIQIAKEIMQGSFIID